MTQPLGRLGAAGAALALLVASSRSAEGGDPPRRAADPAVVQGIVRPASEPGDALRDAVSVLLYLPRKTVEYLFLATGMAAGLVRDEQVVPRVEELVDPRPGEITIFPTLFLETRQAPSLGARMLASGAESATSLAAGFGGPDDVNGEARIRLGWARPLPIVFALEGLYDVRSSLDFQGVGQDPARDARNRFQPGAPRDATYLERRTRFIGSLGVRPGKDIELFASSSFTLSRVADAPDAGPGAISRVFAPGSVPGAPAVTGLGAMAESRIVYSELAVRLDTRPTLGRPSAGVLLEGYGGPGIGARGDPTRFVRFGGRAAVFIPILRRTNILSPRVTVDGLYPLGDAPIPFTALASQPDFRGVDTRRDRVSAIASVDYRWVFSRFIGARVFGDLASVARSFPALLDADPRLAVGIGIDLFSPSTEIGQIAVSYSTDGPRLLLSFGTTPGFGDRQHRY